MDGWGIFETLTLLFWVGVASFWLYAIDFNGKAENSKEMMDKVYSAIKILIVTPTGFMLCLIYEEFWRNVLWVLAGILFLIWVFFGDRQ